MNPACQHPCLIWWYVSNVVRGFPKLTLNCTWYAVNQRPLPPQRQVRTRNVINLQLVVKRWASLFMRLFSTMFKFNHIVLMWCFYIRHFEQYHLMTSLPGSFRAINRLAGKWQVFSSEKEGNSQTTSAQYRWWLQFTGRCSLIPVSVPYYWLPESLYLLHLTLQILRILPLFRASDARGAWVWGGCTTRRAIARRTCQCAPAGQK